MPEVSAQIAINASPARAWTVLTDFAQYAQWNPFIIKVVGVARGESPVDVTMRLAGRKTKRIDAEILKAGNYELNWQRKSSLGSLLSEEHRFKIQETLNGCTFASSEHFSGMFCSFLGQSFFDERKARLTAMNEALKARAEGQNLNVSVPGSLSNVRNI